MKIDKLREYVIREEVMKLLSEEELAKVGRGDTANLREGQEYLDLEQAVQGVRRATGTSVPTGSVLPREDVPDATWSKILTLIGQSQLGDDSKARER
jgi:hypothetical protein